MRLAVLMLGFVLVPVVGAQTVAVYTSADSVRVGERFEITLVARHDGPDQAVLPDTSRAFAGPDVSVLERIRQGSSVTPAGRVDSAVYRVAAFALDTLVVPPIAVGFVQGRDTLLRPSNPLRVPMIATAPPDANGLRPTHERMDFPLPIWVWLVALLALAILGLLIYLFVRRLRRRAIPADVIAPTLSPADAARQRLAALGSFDLSDDEQVKPYYVELTEALRQYVETTTGIPALEQTSSELVRAVRNAVRAGSLPEGVGVRLAELFAVSDYAKFADGRPAPDEGLQARNTALNIIDQIESYRTRVEAVPPPVEVADA